MKKLKRKLGFTIAELVIATMLVAGIAMLMLPSLKSDNERQVFGTSLKKTMTELQQITQAVGMLEARGKVSLAEGDVVTLKKTFPEIMKEATKKTYKSYLKDYKPQLVGYDKDNPLVFVYNQAEISDNNIFISKSGKFFYFDEITDATTGEITNNLIVDVNGKKQPNKTGKDIYYFSVGKTSMSVAESGTVASAIAYGNETLTIEPWIPEGCQAECVSAAEDCINCIKKDNCKDKYSKPVDWQGCAALFFSNYKDKDGKNARERITWF